MWESPIQLLQTQMQMEMDGEMLRAVQKVGVNVDKEELLRALAYDRGQYDKGYKDGVNAVCERIEEKLERKLSQYENKDFDTLMDMGIRGGLSVAIKCVKEEMS